MKSNPSHFFALAALTSLVFFSCKKSNPAPTPADPCTSVTISVTTSVINNTPCQAVSGSITVNASGSSGYTYSINGGSFQASNTFTGLNTGVYNIIVKDANGCSSATQSATIGNVAAGPLFTNVKNIINANCVNCHLNGNSDGGVNFDNQCNILAKWDRINTRCVTLGNMPPQGLTAAEKSQIAAWVNAGHGYTN